MYFGLSFSRVGADFRGLLPPLFHTAALRSFNTALHHATARFAFFLFHYLRATLKCAIKSNPVLRIGGTRIFIGGSTWLWLLPLDGLPVHQRFLFNPWAVPTFHLYSNQAVFIVVAFRGLLSSQSLKGIQTRVSVIRHPLSCPVWIRLTTTANYHHFSRVIAFRNVLQLEVVAIFDRVN